MNNRLFRVFVVGLFLFGRMELSAQDMSAATYIDNYKELAISEMKRSGIPASITLAQGLLESGSGNSRLATRYNNHFGIKCHDWEGEKVYLDDDRKDECFRHYKNAGASFLDHTDFLMTRSRYAFLFAYPSTDYINWAKGLRRAGYATDPKYPQRLIELIEKHELHRYDTASSTNPPNKENTENKTPSKTASKKSGKSIDNFTVHVDKYPIKENNRTEYIVAKEGDTYSSLAAARNMLLWQLPKYNDAGDAPLHAGDKVYLEPKRRRAERGKDTHRLRKGESMRDVSQQYGIRLQRLYVMNCLAEGAEPAAGTPLNLRKKKR
jgi:hypothetical protein